MTAPETGAATTAPYLPWASFTGFVAELKRKDPIPPRIDSSLLTTKSGAVQTQLRGALRFFGLGTGNGATLEVTQALRDLVAAYDTPSWKEKAASLLEHYRPILAGIDTGNATQRMLEEAFAAKGGLKGQSPVDKASRFYLALAKEAGQTLSPHFKLLRPGASGTRRQSPQRPKKATANGESTVDQAQSSPPAAPTGNPPEPGQTIKPLPDQAFSVFLPDSMTEDDTFFAIDHLIRYLKLRRKWFANITLQQTNQANP